MGIKDTVITEDLKYFLSYKFTIFALPQVKTTREGENSAQ
jgi:hypothetical protein